MLNRPTWNLLLVFCFMIALWSYLVQAKHLGKSKDSFYFPEHVKQGEKNSKDINDRNILIGNISANEKIFA